MSTMEFGEIAAWGLVAAALAYALGVRRGVPMAVAAATLAALVTKGLLLSGG